VLTIFIALKNPSPSAGFEPANVGSSRKHANNYTTEDDNARINPRLEMDLHESSS
jgi:hypothetical protein